MHAKYVCIIITICLFNFIEKKMSVKKFQAKNERSGF
jgi:hypothetical protein